MMEPRGRRSVAVLNGTPKREFYIGPDLKRVRSLFDLRARTHKLMPKFVLEYLEGGAGDEATLLREREAFAEWRFLPRQLVDVSGRNLRTSLLGKTTPVPLVVAPTGLNGLFRHRADILLAEGAATRGVPFTQSTMSNERMEDVARVPGLRHWWQLYVFGGDEVWQELLRRAENSGCEALVLTTNAQIYGNREWDDRTQISRTLPTPSSVFDAALHPRWFARTLLPGGMPIFKNVVDFVPRDKRGFFESAFWIRDQMPKSLSWETVAKIRSRWKGAFLLKGLLHPDDVRRALDSGVDGIILGAHGGRQADWSVSSLDVLPQARRIIGDRITLMMSGGIRRGTDLLKALALGADAALVGRAPLYGLCAAGRDGVSRALELIEQEAVDELGQIGLADRAGLVPDVLVSGANIHEPGGTRGSAAV